MDVCRRVEPPLLLQAGHRVACHLYDDAVDAEGAGRG
jgi:hypothetical protein